MQSGVIPDLHINASSEYSPKLGAHRGRLHTQEDGYWKGAWAAGIEDDNQWLQIDLGWQYTKVTRVATQGRNAADKWTWVTKYKLSYSDDDVNFQYHREQGQTIDKVIS